MLSLKNKILLGSQSPRRRDILNMAGIEFRLADVEHQEEIPQHITIEPEETPLYLAEQKAVSLAAQRKEDEILLTADTLVFLDHRIIGKPRDKQDAFDILQALAGKMHKVISGVCLMYGGGMTRLSDETEVYFRLLDLRDIEYYIDHYPVMDKAGAYGVQDWIGLVGIERINGSYFNVMGLPIHKVYEELIRLENLQ